MSTFKAIRVLRPDKVRLPGQRVVATSDHLESSSDLLRISVRQSDYIDVVALAGEMDIATAPRLASTIHRLLTEGRTDILIDLDAVTFIDGAAIRALITATCDVALAGGTLWVTHNARCLRLLKITDEAHRLNITEGRKPGGNQGVRDGR